jgi:hypothetical protein
MQTALSHWAGLLALVASLASGPAHAVDEQELKAAIVFNLLLFVDWPAGALAPGASLVMCVSPTNELAVPLKALQGRSVRDQRLDVREVAPGASRNACHALYLDPADVQLPAPAGGAASSATLVICDDVDRPPASAAVVLRHVGGRIGFDVQFEAARKSHQVLSSKLLRLARHVSER